MSSRVVSKKCVLGALLAGAFTVANAASVSVSFLTPFVPVDPNGTTINGFLPKFNPALGTLTGVQLSWTPQERTEFTISYLPNHSGFANWGNIGATSQITLASQVISVASLFGPQGFAWTDQTCTQSPCEINATFGNGASSTTIIDQANWSLFEGTGDFDIQIDNLLVSENFASGGGFQLAATETLVEALATVTFTYDAAVPEPASLALVGLGLLGLVGARRAKKV